MRQASPGNRLVKGDSGIVFEVSAAVASGLIGNKTAAYIDDESGPAAVVDGAAGGPPPPPKAGPKSSKDVWAAYATANGVDVSGCGSRDEMIAALTDAGIPTE